MATRNVAGSREERKRGLETVEAARREMESAVARYAAAELASSGGSGRESHAALLDERVRRAALTAARLGLESAFREDRSDCGAANAPACGKCGERMRYVGRKDAAVETALGRARVAMGRYACGACGKTVRPRRAALDVAVSMTPSARRMASLAGSSCCYAEADGLLAGLAGVNYGAKRIERATRAVGDDLETRREKALSGSITVLGGDGGGAAPERKSLKEGEILSVALDGTGVPARPSETAGRAGKDGAARTREAKVGALWVTAPDGAGGRRTVDGSVRYFAAVESAADDGRGDSPVARRLLRELAAAGFAPDDVGVCIGDGAAWLRRLYAEWFPNAVAIVDFFHAAEYIWAAARARYGPESDLAKRWAVRLCRLLKAGRADEVLAALRRAGGGESARAADYIEARRGQMRYDEYLARGWPIGSGRAEAACKTVVGRRLKCTGMRWSVAGANPVLWVRCANLSGWLDDYWDQRLGIAA